MKKARIYIAGVYGLASIFMIANQEWDILLWWSVIAITITGITFLTKKK